jgi:hypothetical protein
VNDDSGGGVWGLLDRAVDGLSSTGVSVFEGAGNVAQKYQDVRTKLGLNAPATPGAKAPTQPRVENVTDKTAELNTADVGGVGDWVRDNQALVILGFVGLLAVALIVKLR